MALLKITVMLKSEVKTTSQIAMNEYSANKINFANFRIEKPV